MAAGEALLLAALHQASTMALLTCFWPAHTNTIHHNVNTELLPAGSEKRSRPESCRLHQLMPTLMLLHCAVPCMKQHMWYSTHLAHGDAEAQ